MVSLHIVVRGARGGVFAAYIAQQQSRQKQPNHGGNGLNPDGQLVQLSEKYLFCDLFKASDYHTCGGSHSQRPYHQARHSPAGREAEQETLEIWVHL